MQRADARRNGDRAVRLNLAFPPVTIVKLCRKHVVAEDATEGHICEVHLMHPGAGHRIYPDRRKHLVSIMHSNSLHENHVRLCRALPHRFQFGIARTIPPSAGFLRGIETDNNHAIGTPISFQPSTSPPRTR